MPVSVDTLRWNTAGLAREHSNREATLVAAHIAEPTETATPSDSPLEATRRTDRHHRPGARLAAYERALTGGR